MIVAVVPAAGKSTRMQGQNKLLIPFKGKPLVAHAVDTLLNSEVDEIIVVVGHQADKIREALEGRKVTFVENQNFREGLSTSIRAGLNAVPPEARAIMFCLADQPMVEPQEINRLIGAFEEAKAAQKSIVIPSFQGQRGNPVVLDSSYKKVIAEVVGDMGCRRVIKQNRDQVFMVEMETDHILKDIDRIEDYKQLARTE